MRGVESELVGALRRAVAAAPGDTVLRLHLAQQLLAEGDPAGTVTEIAAVLQIDPSDEAARQAMSRALAASAALAESPTADALTTNASSITEFDWDAAESQVDEMADPMLDTAPAEDAAELVETSAPQRFRVEPPDITLADVGGMRSVKDRLNAAFLAPLRNPTLRAKFRKSLRGGLLLYGPPGCGKTLIARALAGELGAQFMSIGLTDILDPSYGMTERNLHDAFLYARRQAPCVLFFDEIDALGGRRSQRSLDWTRGSINQLLTELDGVDGTNEGVFVLAATNQPWDVDPALRRPGHLDRTVLVLPPDESARRAIFQHHLKDRPLAGDIEIASLAKASDGLSGADIALVCEAATEIALMHAASTGEVRDISQNDLSTALSQVRPSIGAWLDSARNVVLFGDDDGTYSELRTYLKKAKRL